MKARRSLVALVLLMGGLLVTAPARSDELAIGVLAFRGADWAQQRWRPTAEYLSGAVAGHTFTIVPLDLARIGKAVADGRVDFLLTNPGNYIELENRYGVSRIATLRNLRYGEPYTVFGAVIFARADRDDIASLKDLEGKSFMAVSEHAFGGFQMAWLELEEAGIDPFRDFSTLEFSGFPQDDIVYAVRDGDMDAGTVRTDILERMAGEGRIDIADFKILGQRTTPGFPFVHSTRLYPEWPFAKARHTPDDLAQQVAVALLTLGPESQVVREGSYAGWTIPLDYGPVHSLFQRLRIGPYAELDRITLAQVFDKYRHWLVAALAIALLMIAVTAYVIRMNRRMALSQQALHTEVQERKEAEARLARHRDTLEQRVRERTLALTEDIRARERVEEELRRSEATLRTLYEITSPQELDFEAKVRALLEAGCRHFDMPTGVFASIEGDRLAVVECVCPASGLAKGDTVTVDDPFWKAAVARPGIVALERGALDGDERAQLSPFGDCRAYFGTAVQVNTEPFGPLGFMGDAPRGEPFSSVDRDILQLMAQWIGGEMERGLAQEQSRQRQDEIAHVSRLGTMGEMASGLAHELNQPLTAIVNYTRGCVRRLKSGREPVDAIVDAMEEAVGEAERAAEVIKRLRAFVRKGEPQRLPTDINDAVRDAVRLLEAEAGRWGITLHMELDAELPQVAADSIQIEQVVLNLVRNGIEAMNAGDARDRVLRVRTRRLSSGDVEVGVMDSGPGLSETQLDEIFNPFVTSKRDGMGMGLSISRSIAEAHGGQLTAESGETGGAHFRLTLPASEERDERSRSTGSLRR